MAIVRNACPLLEFSTDQRVCLSPETPEKTLPRLCLVTYFEEILDAFVDRYGAEEIDAYETEMRAFPVYLATVDGYEVCVTLGALGAGSAAKQADYLYGHGAQTIIACDSCGILDPGVESGTIVIAVRAMRDEGASYHYIPAARFIDLQEKYIDKARGILALHNVPYAKCTTWTTDAPYRESFEMVAYRRDEGCRVVETQCAAMAAVAKCRGRGFGEILYAAERVDDQDLYGDSISDAFEIIRKRTFLVALELLCRSEEKVMHSMELQPAFFDQFRRGEKSIEIRCLDEKRRNIRVGDTVQLEKPNGEYMRMKVTELLACDSFGELYERTTPEELGFPGVSRKDFITAMRGIYPVTREKQLGVLGIRMEPM